MCRWKTKKNIPRLWIGGGHTFGKTHGAGDPAFCESRTEKQLPLKSRALGLKSKFRQRPKSDKQPSTSGLK